jgi:hypothetical protein
MPSHQTPPSFAALVFDMLATQWLVMTVDQTICQPCIEIWQSCADECYQQYLAHCHGLNAAERAGCRMRVIRHGIAASPQLIPYGRAVMQLAKTRCDERRPRVDAILQHIAH